jgi:hypothetical protein
MAARGMPKERIMLARNIRGRAVSGSLSTTLWRYRAGRHRRAVPVFMTALLAAGVASAPSALGAVAAPGLSFAKLTLLNGWGTAPFDSASPAIAKISGIVYLKGALSTSGSNTNNVAFILPPGFRPSKYVNVPVDMCNSTGGELNIAPDGTTQVISEGASSTAACFTSLDGASFALSPTSFTPLKLRPGWKEFGSFFRKGAVRLVSGIVHFEGEIRTAGKNLVAFTLPTKFRPAKNVRVQINVCTGSIGWLAITPQGVVRVNAENNELWAVQCGTSLDGASFALSSKSFTPLKLANGWMNAPLGSAKATVGIFSGIVRFRGAIWTKGTSNDPFVLPKAFRPTNEVFVPVALCGGDNGRLEILPNGVAFVQTEGSDFAHAQCLTSLDGVWFAR